MPPQGHFLLPASLKHPCLKGSLAIKNESGSAAALLFFIAGPIKRDHERSE
jgi:hypothetical protein